MNRSERVLPDCLRIHIFYSSFLVRKRAQKAEPIDRRSICSSVLLNARNPCGVRLGNPFQFDQPSCDLLQN